MALPLYALEILAPHIRGASVLCLGYPDILASAEEVRERFGIQADSFTSKGGVHGLKRPLVETMAFFRRMEATLDCVDVKAHRGPERIVDLNEPCDLGAYDLVIDPGTVEHCFNIGQAIMNAARAVKPGGRIYHCTPMSLNNHGFWNACPTSLWDFYTQNGWELERFEARKGKSFEPITRTDATGRAKKILPDVSLVCVARRCDDRRLQWPVQSKYLDKLQKAA